MKPEIARILTAPESETTEFKGPQATIEALARHTCAMLNQQGGIILWGVTDGRKVVGLASARERAKKLNDYILQHTRPRPLVSTSVEDHGSRQLVTIEVPPGSDKPYSVDREIWVRVGRQTLRATPDMSSALVERSAAQFERWEREPMPGFSLDACDTNELSRTRSDLEAVNRFGGTVPDSDEELLHRLSLSRAGQLTNACAVLFARDSRLWAPNLALRITSYAQTRKGPIGADTALEGPAVKLVQDAVAIIQQHTGFSGRFEQDVLQRADRPAYPLYALREGLVNAVVHRDYSSLGDVRVEIYPDSLVIQNPGRLPEGWTIADLKRQHVSTPTNPDIAQVFFLRRLMERLGMGTQRLIAECKELGAKAPVWSIDHGTVTLRLFRAPVVATLAPRPARFVERSKPGRMFTLRDYARSAKVSERQARRDVQELVRLQVVQRLGSGPATSYRLQSQHGTTDDRDALKSVAAMEDWFLQRYEDPAVGVPYDSREGGYQYHAGGPYNAEEELRKAFGGRSPKVDQMIEEAARHLASAGPDWVKRGQY